MTTRNEVILALCIAALAVAGVGTAQATDAATHTRQAAAKKTAEVAKEDTLQIDAVIDMPKVVKQVPPKYPDSARRRGQQGIIYVRALVNKNGTVGQALVPAGKGLAPDLDRAAVEAIRQWTFEPAKKKGKPVAVYIVVPVKFALK